LLLVGGDILQEAVISHSEECEQTTYKTIAGGGLVALSGTLLLCAFHGSNMDWNFSTGQTDINGSKAMKM